MTNKVLIFPDAEDFLSLMDAFQEAYNEKKGVENDDEE